MTKIQNYNLILTVNSMTFASILPAGNTAVDIFVAFPTVNRTAFTNYSLIIAVINSVGLSNFTRPVSVGKAKC